jgi:TolB-like protein
MTKLFSLRFLIAAVALCIVCPLQAYALFGFGSTPINREITSTPSGATIYFSQKEDESGTKLGNTPFKDTIKDNKTSPAGYYRLEKEGYKPKTVYVPNQEKPTDVKQDIELQQISTIRLKVISNPPGATILFGKDINNISKELGPAPYTESKTDAASEQKPFWEKGVYKALLKGYRPKVVASERSEENKQITFELEPLPLPPEPPKVEYPDKKTVAWKPVNLDAYKNPDADFSSGIPLAVMNFKENSALDIGSQAADSLIMKLQRKGFVVIEREIIEKAISDLKGAAPADKKASSGIELIKELSVPLKTRYFMIGSINEYFSGNETIIILPFIPDKEKERYQKEYDAYIAYFKSENISNPQPVKTLQEWELEFNSKSQSLTMPVARVSITAKILDVKSGKAVWTGIANVSENGLQKGLNSILSAMADSIGDQGDGKVDSKSKR